MADLSDQLDSKKRPAGGGDYAPWWNNDNFDRSEGDTLVGVLVEKHYYTDPGSDEHDVGTVKGIGEGVLSEGDEVATPTHSSLVDFIADREVGDVVLIEYKGIVKSNSGRDTNTYDVSYLSEEEWRETDQEDLIEEVWDSWDPSESSHAEGNGSSGGDISDAVTFAEDAVKMHGGEVPLEGDDSLDHFVNEVRDYGVDVEEIVEESDNLELDDGTVKEA